MGRQIDGHGRAYPGLLIVVIGPDGAGKSTLLHGSTLYRLLSKNIESIVDLCAAPTTYPIGRAAYDLARSAETPLDHQLAALAMASDRLYQWKEYVKPCLDYGHTVICDRWAACSGAYQGVTPELHGYILSINQPVPHPDFTVYLRMDDVEELARRAGCGVDNETATIERLTAIQQRYEANAVHWQGNYGAFHTVTVDGMTPDEVAERVASAIVARFPDVFKGGA